MHYPRFKSVTTMKISTLAVLDGEGFKALAALDKKLVDKYGDSFSNQAWDSDNFAYPLPSKYDLSHLLYYNEHLAGYCIASEKHGAVYIHRFAVERLEEGLAGKFFSRVLEYYDRPVHLMVNTQNRPAIDFYAGFGFDIAEDSDAIRDFVAPELEIEGPEIIIEKDYRCYLMRKD